jgi:hypothetical protein
VIAVWSSVNLPWAETVLPRSGVAGAAQSFAVRRLGTVASPVFLFGGTPAAAATLRPDGTYLVTPPALAAGRWSVTVQNGLGLDWLPARLELVDPAPRAAASLASAGRKASITFDDATGLLYLANPGAGQVERYAAASGWALTARPLPGLKDAALSPDGQRLVAVTADGVRTLDVAALDGPLTTIPGTFSAAEQALPWRLAFAADGQATVVTPTPGGCAGALDCGIHFANLGFWQGYTGPVADGWSLAAPDDLSAVWLLRQGGTSPAPLARYTPWGGGLDFATAVVFDGTAIDLDRHGTRALLLDVDPAFAATSGRLADLATGLRPGALPATTAAALLSQDGTRAVAFDGASRTVRRFDLAAPPDPVSGRFVELGAPGGFAPPADPGAAPVLTMSIDERTLFLAGDAALVICPLP